MDNPTVGRRFVTTATALVCHGLLVVIIGRSLFGGLVIGGFIVATETRRTFAVTAMS
jgi:hypothetical protein